ncbi:MAG: metal-dependent hydrolase [Actinomadura sp.]
MMGHTHALSGAAAWLAAAPLLTSESLLGSFAVELSPAQLAAGTAVCAGAALLPDLDHHDGSIANTFGPVTQILCKGVNKISGGHRHATHSLLFVLAMGLGTQALANYAKYAWWVILLITVGMGLRALGIGFREKHYVTGLLNGFLAVALVFLMRDLDMGYAGWAVGLGCLAHIVGDCLTPQGCPLLWPAPWRMGLPVVGTTNGKIENFVVAPLLSVVILVFIVQSAVGDEITGWLTS